MSELQIVTYVIVALAINHIVGYTIYLALLPRKNRQWKLLRQFDDTLYMDEPNPVVDARRVPYRKLFAVPEAFRWFGLLGGLIAILPRLLFPRD